MSRRLSALRLLLALAFLWAGALGLAASAQAEIYKWKDETGRLHFAQDLSRVPMRYRAQAKGAASEASEAPAIQVYDAGPASPKRPVAKRGRASASGSGKTHKIRVQKTGSTMLVKVRLNDSVIAPFYVDTGASDVVLPEYVAKELGYDLENARTAYYGTANGTIQQAVVTLDSVQLGSARAEKIPASVNRSMSTGLLGLSFFNHFKYRVDPGSGVITLEENGLVEAGRIRGGRSRMQWRAQFGRLIARRDAYEKALDDGKSRGARRKAELEAGVKEADRQMEMLEREADEARVPMNWRY